LSLSLSLSPILNFELQAANFFLNKKGICSILQYFAAAFVFLQFEAVAVVQNFSTQLGTLSNLVNNTCHIKQEF